LLTEGRRRRRRRRNEEKTERRMRRKREEKREAKGRVGEGWSVRCPTGRWSLSFSISAQGEADG
jgi:hypothetical protein